MRLAVRKALEQNVLERRSRLGLLDADEKKGLLQELIFDFFVSQRRELLKWAALTGQSAQIDTGYIAQRVASVVLAEPGQGFKGKGLDLADGGEVKSAATLSGVDRPRWNHNLGSLEDDSKRREKSQPTRWETYLASPLIFYVLFDRVPESVDQFRVRAWGVSPERDRAWTSLVQRFVRSRQGSTYNLQLHPPIGQLDDIVVNELGNLDFSRIKIFEAHFADAIEADDFEIDWQMEPHDGWKKETSTGIVYQGLPRGIKAETADDHSLPPWPSVLDQFPSLAGAPHRDSAPSRRPLRLL